MHDQTTDVPYGYCHCGCGEQTSIARQSVTRYGHVKGEPVRFKPGHCNRRTPDAYDVRDCGYETPCWVWKRALHPVTGYALTRSTVAHKVIWEQMHGPVPDGLELDHLCRNRRCVNPGHLEPVTHTENLRRGDATVLTANDVLAIRASTETHRAIAARFSISASHVSRVRNYRVWKDV